MKQWKTITPTNGSRKKVGLAIHVADKMDFKSKIVTSDKEGHNIMRKRSIHQENITIISTYTPNICFKKI